jgi:trehalose 6-phosphate synthase
MDTLFAYDVVGFQTEQDCQNFGRYVRQSAEQVTPETHPNRADGREPLVREYPIGIDADAFSAMATTPQAESRIRQLVRGSITNHVIGVDRLDYSKGLPDRFRAFRRLLEQHPEHRKNTVLMQIAPPTRGELTAYAEIRTELEQLSGAINGQFGDFDWTPIRYVHRSIARDTLAALFRGSKVGLVTPLRDGMNLVAKEYVAAQDENSPGVLVLSQFAGAAADLKEAIIVNPHDPDEVAAGIDQAIRMPLDERKERHRALNARVHERDAAAWRKAFLADLSGQAAG